MIHQSTFSIGDNVKVIDPQEMPSEWATFVIIDSQIDSHSHRYCLVPQDKYPYEYLWATADEICPITLFSKN